MSPGSSVLHITPASTPRRAPTPARRVSTPAPSPAASSPASSSSSSSSSFDERQHLVGFFDQYRAYHAGGLFFRSANPVDAETDVQWLADTRETALDFSRDRPAESVMLRQMVADIDARIAALTVATAQEAEQAANATVAAAGASNMSRFRAAASMAVAATRRAWNTARAAAAAARHQAARATNVDRAAANMAAVAAAATAQQAEASVEAAETVSTVAMSPSVDAVAATIAAQQAAAYAAETVSAATSQASASAAASPAASTSVSSVASSVASSVVGSVASVASVAASVVGSVASSASSAVGSVVGSVAPSGRLPIIGKTHLLHMMDGTKANFNFFNATSKAPAAVATLPFNMFYRRLVMSGDTGDHPFLILSNRTPINEYELLERVLGLRFVQGEDQPINVLKVAIDRNDGTERSWMTVVYIKANDDDELNLYVRAALSYVRSVDWMDSCTGQDHKKHRRTNKNYQAESNDPQCLCKTGYIYAGQGDDFELKAASKQGYERIYLVTGVTPEA